MAASRNETAFRNNAVSTPNTATTSPPIRGPSACRGEADVEEGIAFAKLSERVEDRGCRRARERAPGESKRPVDRSEHDDCREHEVVDESGKCDERHGFRCVDGGKATLRAADLDSRDDPWANGRAGTAYLGRDPRRKRAPGLIEHEHGEGYLAEPVAQFVHGVRTRAAEALAASVEPALRAYSDQALTFA